MPESDSERVQRGLFKIANDLAAACVDLVDGSLEPLPAGYDSETFKVTVLLSAVGKVAGRYPTPEVARFLHEAIDRMGFHLGRSVSEAAR